MARGVGGRIEPRRAVSLKHRRGVRCEGCGDGCDIAVGVVAGVDGVEGGVGSVQKYPATFAVFVCCVGRDGEMAG